MVNGVCLASSSRCGQTRYKAVYLYVHFKIMFSDRRSAIDLGSTESGGSIDPRLFQVEVKAYLLTPTFKVYKACLLLHLGHCHAPSTVNAIHSVHYAHKIDMFMSYSPCIKHHSRTVILCPQNTENIHQIDNERKPSRASSFATFPP